MLRLNKVFNKMKLRRLESAVSFFFSNCKLFVFNPHRKMGVFAQKIMSFFRHINKLLHLTYLVIVILLILTLAQSWQIKKPDNLSQPRPTPSPFAIVDGWMLKIPALDIQAPVISDVNGADTNAYNKALEKGLAHLKGSAKPGQGSNIFIFGHSSYYWYKPGDYKEIFKNLEDIKIGDEIIVWYNQKEYHYIVDKIKTVLPNQVDVIKPTQIEQLSLMTCVPPGTTLKRLIVIAKLAK